MLAMLCCSCAAILGAETVPEAKGEYNPTGEISYLERGATFDQWRVRNPHANLTKKVDGSWGGTMLDPFSVTQPIDVTVTPKKISGVNLILTLESQDEQNTVMVGQWQGRIMRFEFHPDQVIVRTGSDNTSFTLFKHDANSYGMKGELILKGDANKPPQPWPQIGLAMLAAFGT
jgi:hypothetical protein